MEKLPGAAWLWAPGRLTPTQRKLLPTGARTLCCLTGEGDDIQVPPQPSRAVSWTQVTAWNLQVQQGFVEREGARVGT